MYIYDSKDVIYKNIYFMFFSFIHILINLNIILIYICKIKAIIKSKLIINKRINYMKKKIIHKNNN